MSGEKKRKRGRPMERPGAKRIGFYVSAEDHKWLTALPNRSEWIAEMVEKARKNEHTSALSRAEKTSPHQDAEK